MKRADVEDARLIFTENGLVHRDNDLPAIVYDDGTHEWYRYGKLHRDGGRPAIIAYDELGWFRHGVPYRDGNKPSSVTPEYVIFSQPGHGAIAHFQETRRRFKFLCTVCL